MGREAFSSDDFYAQLEELGEAKVREFLATGRWGKVGPKFELVNVWLAQLERTRHSASQSEEIEIARSAKDAAWSAAEAAKEAAAAAREAAREAKAANTRTTIALTLTAIMAIAAVMGLFLK